MAAGDSKQEREREKIEEERERETESMGVNSRLEIVRRTRCIIISWGNIF